jgi:hypothetical protein
MVLFNIGKGLSDATCRTLGLPHMIVGTTVGNSERIFSSGNERTPVFFNPPVRLDLCRFRFAGSALQVLLCKERADQAAFSGRIQRISDIPSTPPIDSDLSLT